VTSGERSSGPVDALLLLSFGGPEGPDDVLPFLERVTGGRGVPRERLLEVAEHYAHFGGVSPLNARNRELVGRIRAALADAGIDSAVYYTTPLHLQPALRFLGYEPGSLPATEEAAAENFSVPLWPGIPVEAQERVVDAVRSAVAVAYGR
jgi:dTDP-4-amino-4,6-dideoxygalactose transaminase